MPIKVIYTTSNTYCHIFSFSVNNPHIGSNTHTAPKKIYIICMFSLAPIPSSLSCAIILQNPFYPLKLPIRYFHPKSSGQMHKTLLFIQLLHLIPIHNTRLIHVDKIFAQLPIETFQRLSYGNHMIM